MLWITSNARTCWTSDLLFQDSTEAVPVLPAIVRVRMVPVGQVLADVALVVALLMAVLVVGITNGPVSAIDSVGKVAPGVLRIVQKLLSFL